MFMSHCVPYKLRKAAKTSDVHKEAGVESGVNMTSKSLPALSLLYSATWAALVKVNKWSLLHSYCRGQEADTSTCAGMATAREVHRRNRASNMHRAGECEGMAGGKGRTGARSSDAGADPGPLPCCCCAMVDLTRGRTRASWTTCTQAAIMVLR